MSQSYKFTKNRQLLLQTQKAILKNKAITKNAVEGLNALDRIRLYITALVKLEERKTNLMFAMAIPMFLYSLYKYKKAGGF